MNPIYAPVFRSGMLLGMSKRQDAASRWRGILLRQAGSGLSVAAFCRQSRIPPASFYVWRRKLREAAAFTEVRVRSEHNPRKDAPPAQRALELVLPGGRSIVVRPGFDRGTRLALVDALERGTSQDGMAEVGGLRSVNAKQESGA
ncbi:MAG: hypothetical protein KJ749_03335 [Planctomycetes bacterium]|nr:hypothetical protein [Planctomycetota bacterium]